MIRPVYALPATLLNQIVSGYYYLWIIFNPNGNQQSTVILLSFSIFVEWVMIFTAFLSSIRW